MRIVFDLDGYWTPLEDARFVNNPDLTVVDLPDTCSDRHIDAYVNAAVLNRLDRLFNADKETAA